MKKSDLTKYTITFNDITYSSAEVGVYATDEDAAMEVANEMRDSGLDFDAYDGEYGGIDVQKEDSSKIEDKEFEKIEKLMVDKNKSPIHTDDLVQYTKPEWDKEKDKFVSKLHESKIIGWTYDADNGYLFLTTELHALIDVDEVLLINSEKRSSQLSAKDFWMKYGDCPICRKGDTISMLRGKFICSGCKWEK